MNNFSLENFNSFLFDIKNIKENDNLEDILSKNIQNVSNITLYLELIRLKECLGLNVLGLFINGTNQSLVLLIKTIKFLEGKLQEEKQKVFLN